MTADEIYGLEIIDNMYSDVSGIKSYMKQREMWSSWWLIWQQEYEETQRLEYERTQQEWIRWLEKERKSLSSKGKGKMKAASDQISYEGFEGSELMDIWWDHVDWGGWSSSWDMPATSSDNWIPVPIEHDEVGEALDKWGFG